jgi:hypothetical protein
VLSFLWVQAAGFLGIALTILPDILNLAIVIILLYAAFVSCAPVFNDLMWSPDEGIPPPIRGKKWEDFDPRMQVRLAASAEHRPTLKRCAYMLSTFSYARRKFCGHTVEATLTPRAAMWLSGTGVCLLNDKLQAAYTHPKQGYITCCATLIRNQAMMTSALRPSLSLHLSPCFSTTIHAMLQRI